jgi:hypothetical protein
VRARNPTVVRLSIITASVARSLGKSKAVCGCAICHDDVRLGDLGVLGKPIRRGQAARSSSCACAASTRQMRSTP